jgi:hypothetical protein
MDMGGIGLSITIVFFCALGSLGKVLAHFIADGISHPCKKGYGVLGDHLNILGWKRLE